MTGNPPPKRANGSRLIYLDIPPNDSPLRYDAANAVMLEQTALAYLGVAANVASKEELRQMPEDPS